MSVSNQTDRYPFWLYLLFQLHSTSNNYLFFSFLFFFPQLVQEEKLKTINFLFSFIALGSKPHNLMSFIDVVLITCSSYYSYCCCLF